MKVDLRVILSYLLVMISLVLFLSLITTSASAGSVRKGLSSRAYPKPECQSFLITEFSYMNRFHLSSKLPRYVYDDRFLFSWELGLMKNITRRYALGGTLYTAVDDEGSRIGIKARIRRWLSRQLSLDIAPGILITKITARDEKFPGFTGHVGLNITPFFSLTGQVEVIPVKGNFFNPALQSLQRLEGNEISWHVGVKLNSEPGFITGLVAFLFTPIAVTIDGSETRF